MKTHEVLKTCPKCGFEAACFHLKMRSTGIVQNNYIMPVSKKDYMSFWQVKKYTCRKCKHKWEET